MPTTLEALEQTISDAKLLVQRRQFKELVSLLITLQGHLPSFALQRGASEMISAVAREAPKERPDTESLIILLDKLRKDLAAEAAAGARLVELLPLIDDAERLVRVGRYLEARNILAGLQNALPTFLKGDARASIKTLDKEAEKAKPHIAAIVYTLENLRADIAKEIGQTYIAQKQAA